MPRSPAKPLTLLLAGRSSASRENLLKQLLNTEWNILTWSEDEAVEKFTDYAARAEVIVAGRIAIEWPEMPKLRLRQVPSTGLNWISPAETPAGCVVCNAYGHEIAISEYVLAAMLESAIGLVAIDRRFRSHGWKDRKPGIGPNHCELFEKTVGIVGYGHIGRQVAARAQAFGMEVIAASRTVRPAPELAWFGTMDELDRLLTASDFVVVTLPLSEETEGLFDADRFACMKPEAVIINVGRGLVIDEAALYAALVEKRIGGAAIDVWFQYPTDGDPDCLPSRFPFQQLDNVIMTPHGSASTDAMRERRWKFVAENLNRLARGEPLENVCFEGANAVSREAHIKVSPQAPASSS